MLWDRLEQLLAWLRTQQPGDPRPRRRRHRPAARTRLRPPGRAGLDRQEHDAHRPPAGQLHRSWARCCSTASWLPDAPHVADHCGTCTRCLDACPTDAFAGPYQLDARRCISYWTIEHRGPIADEFAGQLDGWVFGCDVCQDVCPWNRKAPAGQLPELEPAELAEPDLIEWLDRDGDVWKSALKGTALARAKRVGLVRNAALVLGAGRIAEAVPALGRRLTDPAEDPDGPDRRRVGAGTDRNGACARRHCGMVSRRDHAAVRDAAAAAMQAVRTGERTRAAWPRGLGSRPARLPESRDPSGRASRSTAAITRSMSSWMSWSSRQAGTGC